MTKPVHKCAVSSINRDAKVQNNFVISNNKLLK